MATRTRTPRTSKAKAGDSAAGTHQPVDALKHRFDDADPAAAKRLFIPSREEAGQEQDAIAGQPTVKQVPLNPVTHRGQDPELYWLNKYGPSDQDQRLAVDIRSLYRHEHIAPERLIAQLYRFKGRDDAQNELFTNELFGNPLALDELDKPAGYYKYSDKWQNRLIQGDSLLVMTSLLEREGMQGQVQCIYIDPPYGIKYGSNWQMRLGDRNVKDGADENLSGEPEVIKAFRDTWELGIHSYLSYLRDRLLVAKELLSASGSCFVQISDDNLHLVRALLDEVFGSDGYVATIAFTKAGGGLQASDRIASVADYLIWYCKDRDQIKYRALYEPRTDPIQSGYTKLELPNGQRRSMTKEERRGGALPDGAVPYTTVLMTKPGPGSKFDVRLNGKVYTAGTRWWGTTPTGMAALIEKGRVEETPSTIRFVTYFSDFPYRALQSLWTGLGGASDPKYVVQTSEEVIKRCILMTTDPGDLVLDPTCGSGTTAHVAEQWGRRWITTDTSRIALNIAKTRLMTAAYPWYRLADSAGQDVRHGFLYKTVPHVTLKSIANGEPPETETLVDQPEVDKKKLRVAGPFTVETLQSFEPLAPDQLDQANSGPENVQRFTERVFEHLKSAGIKNGAKNETARFTRVDVINDEAGYLHAEGWYDSEAGERKAYLHIGPQFGTVSRVAVNEAVKAARARGDCDWLVVMGFGFESDVESRAVSTRVGSFQVDKVRMHDDLMQEGLIKKDKKAASFVTIGEPDIGIDRQGDSVQVEIRGLDIYDPVRDEVKGRSVADISYWMLDDDYDGSNFTPRQVFFCGGDRDEFDKFKRGLSSLAVASTKKAAERTLKIELDDEAFERVYGHRSHPVPFKRGRRLAVRVVSQFGEESTKVLTL